MLIFVWFCEETVGKGQVMDKLRNKKSFYIWFSRTNIYDFTKKKTEYSENGTLKRLLYIIFIMSKTI